MRRERHNSNAGPFFHHSFLFPGPRQTLVAAPFCSSLCCKLFAIAICQRFDVFRPWTFDGTLDSILRRVVALFENERFCACTFTWREKSWRSFLKLPKLLLPYARQELRLWLLSLVCASRYLKVILNIFFIACTLFGDSRSYFSWRTVKLLTEEPIWSRCRFQDRFATRPLEMAEDTLWEFLAGRSYRNI
jgi:hypothetical protein